MGIRILPLTVTRALHLYIYTILSRTITLNTEDGNFSVSMLLYKDEDFEDKWTTVPSLTLDDNIYVKVLMVKITMSLSFCLIQCHVLYLSSVVCCNHTLHRHTAFLGMVLLKYEIRADLVKITSLTKYLLVTGSTNKYGTEFE